MRTDRGQSFCKKEEGPEDYRMRKTGARFTAELSDKNTKNRNCNKEAINKEGICEGPD